MLSRTQQRGKHKEKATDEAVENESLQELRAEKGNCQGQVLPQTGIALQRSRLPGPAV